MGGAVGTDLQKANCPKLTGSIDPKCIAGAVMLQVTRLGGGGYVTFANVLTPKDRISLTRCEQLL